VLRGSSLQMMAAFRMLALPTEVAYH
jgi:hypothetical protein